jgi:hypothetical protein
MTDPAAAAPTTAEGCADGALPAASATSDARVAADDGTVHCLRKKDCICAQAAATASDTLQGIRVSEWQSQAGSACIEQRHSSELWPISPCSRTGDPIADGNPAANGMYTATSCQPDASTVGPAERQVRGSDMQSSAHLLLHQSRL